MQRQRLWDQTGDLNNGGFPAHRNHKESEDEPKILRPTHAVPAEKLVRDIRRATRKHHSAEDKIRIVLEGLCGEESIENIENQGPETVAFTVPFPTPLIFPSASI